VSETKLIRPGQVTLAGWMVMIGSAIVVLTCFDQVSGFQTVDRREAIAKFLSEPPGDGLGLDVDGAIVVLRTLAMVTAGLATACLILGWHVLRRHRPSRVALTIVCVPLFFTGIVAGGFFSSVVAASALMLWSRPARDWFDGVSAASTGREVRHPSGAVGPGTTIHSRIESGTTTPAAPYTETPSQPPAEPDADPSADPAQAPPLGAPYAGLAPPLPVVRHRPDAVLWACVLTWAFSGVTALCLIASVALVPLNREEFLAQAHRQNAELAKSGVSDGALLAMAVIALVGMVLWAIAAMVLAWLVWVGYDWARIALVCSAATAGILALIAVFALVVPLPVMVACGVSMRLLLSPQAAAWGRTRARS